MKSSKWAVWTFALLAVALNGCSDSGSSANAGDKPDGGAKADGGGASAGGGSSGNASRGGGAAGRAGDAGTAGTSATAGRHAPPVIEGLTALRIEPGTNRVVDDGVDPAETAEFRAIGTFDSGERDVTDRVRWSLEDTGLGHIDAGTFTTAGIGGQTSVRVLAGTIEASAEITVVLQVQAHSDGAPDGIEALFPADTSDDTVVEDDTLRIVYPSHETMFPRNLQRVDHQWRADAALDRFEVRFESDVALVRYYTSVKHLLPDLQGWRWLANTHAGRSLQMTVRPRALRPTPSCARSRSRFTTRGRRCRAPSIIGRRGHKAS